MGLGRGRRKRPLPTQPFPRPYEYEAITSHLPLKALPPTLRRLPFPSEIWEKSDIYGGVFFLLQCW